MNQQILHGVGPRILEMDDPITEYGKLFRDDGERQVPRGIIEVKKFKLPTTGDNDFSLFDIEDCANINPEKCVADFANALADDEEREVPVYHFILDFRPGFL
jgi:hypothetical protein